MDLDELKHLKQETWNALNTFALDAGDSRNVGRWEKLSKLYLQLAKQIARMEAADPPEVEIEV